jgi:threonine dehydratase
MKVDIEAIRQAQNRIKPAVVETPLLSAAYLNDRVAATVFIKPENLQPIGAFKLRGAYNRMCQLDKTEKALGVVAYSSGNHAQGVAYAAKLLGMAATIVMPSDAPSIKIEGTRKLGAAIRFYERGSESREAIAEEIAANTGAILVPAFDDPDIIAGQGTCGAEIVAQLTSRKMVADAVLSPCGGGGLMAGASTAVKAMSPDTQIYGVEPQGFHDHYKSKIAGCRMSIDPGARTFCDALLATTPGELTWSINSQTVDEFLQVSDDEVAYAISYAFRYLKLVIEPGGAVALAALLSEKLDVTGQTVCIILSGGNIDRNTLTECLEKYPTP